MSNPRHLDPVTEVRGLLVVVVSGLVCCAAPKPAATVAAPVDPNQERLPLPSDAQVVGYFRWPPDHRMRVQFEEELVSSRNPQAHQVNGAFDITWSRDAVVRVSNWSVKSGWSAPTPGGPTEPVRWQRAPRIDLRTLAQVKWSVPSMQLTDEGALDHALGAEQAFADARAAGHYRELEIDEAQERTLVELGQGQLDGAALNFWANLVGKWIGQELRLGRPGRLEWKGRDRLTDMSMACDTRPEECEGSATGWCVVIDCQQRSSAIAGRAHREERIRVVTDPEGLVPRRLERWHETRVGDDNWTHGRVRYDFQ